jgi:Predicted ATPase
VYISEVKIKNYRCFEQFSTILNQFTLIIGENNSGKTNFIKALSLPLTMGSLDFSQKRLSIADFNSSCVEAFLKTAFHHYRLDEEEQLKDENLSVLIDKIPIIEVEVSFSGHKDNYELSLIHSFLAENEKKPTFSIKYKYAPKIFDFLGKTKELVLSIEDIDRLKWQLLPIDNYEYDIVTVSNEKSISFDKLKNLVVNVIGAERDDFSDSPAMRSNNILTKLLVSELTVNEKEVINLAYMSFS